MTLSVQLVQPIVPSYRLPVFRGLAAAPGIALTVWADSKGEASSLQGVTSDAGFRMRPAPIRRVGPFFWQSASIAAAKSGADVLLLSWASRSLDLTFALRAARRRGVATILWGHGFGTSHPLLGDLRRSRSRDAADAFLLYGPTGRDRLAKAGFAPERLFVAPNAIDQTAIAAAASDWRGDPARSTMFRARHGLGGDPILLYVARLESEKLPQLAIEALSILRRSLPARLVFIGDGAMRSDLEHLARDRGVADAVIFLGAIYKESEIAPWACSASCLVHPGAIGLSIFHAFGYGLPVITSGRAEIQMPEFETHRDGVNGLVYRHADAEDLASKIAQLLEDDALRRRMSEAALATISGPRGRNLDGMVAGFLDAIDFAASRHGKSRH
jgi:glycosyltransferase involved in cell wall biosynthesis